MAGPKLEEDQPCHSAVTLMSPVIPTRRCCPRRQGVASNSNLGMLPRVTRSCQQHRPAMSSKTATADAGSPAKPGDEQHKLRRRWRLTGRPFSVTEIHQGRPLVRTADPDQRPTEEASKSVHSPGMGGGGQDVVEQRQQPPASPNPWWKWR